jgi:hypothetical protein
MRRNSLSRSGHYRPVKPLCARKAIKCDLRWRVGSRVTSCRPAAAFVATHRLEAVPHFTPWRRPAGPHRLVNVVPRLSKRVEPPGLRRVLNNEWRNDREVIHKTIVEQIEASVALELRRAATTSCSAIRWLIVHRPTLTSILHCTKSMV